MADPKDYERFLVSGDVPDVLTPTVEDRVAFIRASLKDRAFKEKVWPHFACFVDASNVSRWDQPPIEKVESKAKLWRLSKCDAALRKLGYVPIMVSDGNLFQLIDEPYEYQRLYTKYPHAVAKGYEADRIVLRGLRKLPEAACVSRDRFDKPDELRDFADVLADRSKFFAYRFDEANEIHLFRGDRPMPHAVRRLAARFPIAARA